MARREPDSEPSSGGRARRMIGELLLPLLVHLAAAAVLFLVALLPAGRMAGNMRGSAKLFAALCTVAYLVAALSRVLGRGTAQPGFGSTAICGVAAFGAAFILFAWAQWRVLAIAGAEMPALVAFTALGSGLFLLLSLSAIRNAAGWKLLFLVAVALQLPGETTPSEHG